jgi:hypothetical protein
MVSLGEVVDRFAQLFDIDKAGCLERLVVQNAKPSIQSFNRQAANISGRFEQQRRYCSLKESLNKC